MKINFGDATPSALSSTKGPVVDESAFQVLSTGLDENFDKTGPDWKKLSETLATGASKRITDSTYTSGSKPTSQFADEDPEGKATAWNDQFIMIYSETRTLVNLINKQVDLYLLMAAIGVAVELAQTLDKNPTVQETMKGHSQTILSPKSMKDISTDLATARGLRATLDGVTSNIFEDDPSSSSSSSSSSKISSNPTPTAMIKVLEEHIQFYVSFFQRTFTNPDELPLSTEETQQMRKTSSGAVEERTNSVTTFYNLINYTGLLERSIDEQRKKLVEILEFVLGVIDTAVKLKAIRIDNAPKTDVLKVIQNFKYDVLDYRLFRHRLVTPFSIVLGTMTSTPGLGFKGTLNDKSLHEMAAGVFGSIAYRDLMAALSSGGGYLGRDFGVMIIDRIYSEGYERLVYTKIATTPPNIFKSILRSDENDPLPFRSLDTWKDTNNHYKSEQDYYLKELNLDANDSNTAGDIVDVVDYTYLGKDTHSSTYYASGKHPTTSLKQKPIIPSFVPPKVVPIPSTPAKITGTAGFFGGPQIDVGDTGLVTTAKSFNVSQLLKEPYISIKFTPFFNGESGLDKLTWLRRNELILARLGNLMNYPSDREGVFSHITSDIFQSTFIGVLLQEDNTEYLPLFNRSGGSMSDLLDEPKVKFNTTGLQTKQEVSRELKDAVINGESAFENALVLYPRTFGDRLFATLFEKNNVNRSEVNLGEMVKDVWVESTTHLY